MKLNYIIDPKVKGVVNIHTSGQISSDDVFPVFQSILQLNGATAVKKGQIYEIVPFGDAKKMYTPSFQDRGVGKSLSEEKYVIQIIPLKFIPVAEVSKMVKPFLSDGADIVEHPSQNILIVGDIASNIRKVLDLIALFDIDLFTDLRVRIYPIFNSDVNEIAKEMERIFASFEVSTKSGRGVGITFTPVTRINVAPGGQLHPQYLREGGGMAQAARSDTGTDEAKIGVFVYYVQNGKAKDMADVLKQIFTPAQGEKRLLPRRRRQRRPRHRPLPPRLPGRREASGPLLLRPRPERRLPLPARKEGFRQERSNRRGRDDQCPDRPGLSERVQICPRDDQKTGPLPQTGIDRALPRRDHAR